MKVRGGGAEQPEIFCFGRAAPLFLALQVQLSVVVYVSAFVMVGTVWSVSCLLFFYSRCPPVPAICKSGGHVPPCPMESAPLLFTLSMQVTTLTLYSAGDSALGMCGCVPSLVPLGNSITGQHVLSMLFSQYSLNLFIRRGKDQYFVTDGIKMGVPNRPPFNPIFFRI